MIVDLLLAVASGIAGGLTVRGLAAFTDRPRPAGANVLVDAPPGTVIVDDAGRRWTVNQRRLDTPSGGPYRLSVDLIERAAP